MARTMSAWAKRYAGRKEAAERAARILGGEVVAVAMGGSGVPGNLANEFSIRVGDRVLTRRQWRKALEDR
mgnify:CR=1 FL=1